MRNRSQRSTAAFRTLRRNFQQKETGTVSSEICGKTPEPLWPEGNPEAIDLDMIREALRGLRFGQVTIIVQDGVIIQVDRMERRRLK